MIDDNYSSGYPLLGSMWFGVDSQGHVGSFWCNGHGAFPQNAYYYPNDWEPDEVLQEYLRQLPVTKGLFDRQCCYQPKGANWRPKEIPAERTHAIFVSSIEPFQEQINKGIAAIIPAIEGLALRWRITSSEDAEYANQTGHVSDWTYFDYADFVLDYFAKRGLYYYTHLAGHCLPGPYGRMIVPTAPVHVDQLPPALRSTFKQTQFKDICFADTPHFHPAKFGPTWTNGQWCKWHDVDDTIHTSNILIDGSTDWKPLQIP